MIDAINQDSRFSSAKPVMIIEKDRKIVHVYKKLLSDGNYALAVFNLGEESALTEIFLEEDCMVRDVWLKEDMGIITAKGVVGYVLTAGEKYSVVCSLLDIENMVSATISSSNTFGTLYWNGKSTKKALLKDIPIHTEIIKGDTVTTSGYSMIYPPHLPIATITGKSKNNGINYELSVELIEDFNTLMTVYAVCFKEKEEIETLLKNSDKR